MTLIFKSILIMSLVSSEIILLILLLKPLTKRLFGEIWQYYIWLVPLFTAVIPFFPESTGTGKSFSITKLNIVRIIPSDILISKTEAAIEKTSLLSKTDSFSVLAFIWLSIMVLLLIRKTIKYIIFRSLITKYSYPAEKDEVIPQNIQLRKTTLFDTPILTGIIKPVLLLPEAEITGKQLSYILKHELTHYKRCDILFKYFCTVIKYIHWFNPLFCIASKQIDIQCEISCDIIVTKHFNLSEKNNYMNTVLDFIAKNSFRVKGFTAGISENKRLLKKRFEAILKFRPVSKVFLVCGIIFAVIITFSAFVLNGFAKNNITYAKELALKYSIETKENLPERSVAEDFSHNNQPKEETVFPEEIKTDEAIVKTPVTEPVESETITVPEAFESGLAETTQEPVINNEPELIIKDSSGEFSEHPNITGIEFTGAVNKEDIISVLENSGINQANGSVNLKNNYICDDFLFENGSKKTVSKITPDENGCITIYFTSDSPEVIETNLSETENKKEVWGAYLPTQNNTAYTFTGLDKDKEYNISLYSPAKENWEIDTEFIIY